MSKKQKLDPAASFVNTDELGVIMSFVDSPQTFTSLQLTSHQVNKQCQSLLNNTQDLIKFYRGFGVDPRFALIRAQKLGLKLPTWSENVLKNGLDLLIYYKAFFRSPGGNSDEFILKYQVSFKGSEMKVIRSKVQNADGSYYYIAPFESKEERNWMDLLAAIEKQSFEKKTPYETLKINTTGYAQDYVFTLYDQTHGSEEMNEDQYDQAWTFVNLDVSVNNEKIFTLVRRTINEEDLNTNPVDSHPITATLFNALQEFCGVERLVECEHDPSCIPECEEPKSKSGIEMDKYEAQDVEVDEDESDNDPICDILHRLIDPGQHPRSVKSNEDDEKDDENEEEQDDEDDE